MGFTKRELIQSVIAVANRPFTIKEMAARVGCSQSTVSSLLLDVGLAYYWQPDSGGNFHKVFFPIDWEPDICREYMDLMTKSGQSKAKLYHPRLSNV